MPKNISRSQAKAGLKYLRKGNGQFNGSVGSGQTTKAKRTSTVKNQSGLVASAVKVERERQRIRTELNQAQRRKLDGILQARQYPKAPKYENQVKDLKKEITALKKQVKRKDSTPLDQLNLKVKEGQLEAAQASVAKLKADKADSKLKRRANRIQKELDTGKRTIEQLNTKEYELLKLLSKKEKANVERNPLEADSYKVEGKRLKIWDGKEYGKYKETTFRRKKEYDYTVGGETLNRNRGVMIHKGETVLGVPDNVQRHKSLDNEALLGELTAAMKFVENHDKGIKAPAPYWDAKSWGKVSNEDKMGKPGVYGQAQLHHINQWSKTPLDSITKRLDAGEITLDEAKALTRETLRPTPNGKPPYELIAAPKGERAYVVLPGGLHDLTSPYYYDLNHPKGIHPDTGERVKFGLPDKAKSGSEYGLTDGREYHNAVRDSYWGEWHRQNAHAAAGEVNRRLRKGLLTPAEVERIMKEKTNREF